MEAVRVVLVVMVVEGVLVVENCVVLVVLVMEGVLVVVCVLCLYRVCWWGTWVGYGVFAGCEIMLVMVVMWELCFLFWLQRF